MNLSRTAVVLIAVLVVLIGASLYLWLFVGTARSEVDPRVGSLRQSFTCEQCGHVFSMTVEQVGLMRRTRGQVFCPKCRAGGARKDVGPVTPGKTSEAVGQPSSAPVGRALHSDAESAASQPLSGLSRSSPSKPGGAPDERLPGGSSL